MDCLALSGLIRSYDSQLIGIDGVHCDAISLAIARIVERDSACVNGTGDLPSLAIRFTRSMLDRLTPPIPGYSFALVPHHSNPGL